MYDVIDIDLNGKGVQRYQVDTSTGEILKKPVYEVVRGYPDNLIQCTDFDKNKRDYRYSRDLEELQELCDFSKYDKDTKADLHIDHKLLDLMLSGIISADNYKNFLLLAQHIQYRNVLVMTREQLVTLFKCDSKKLYRVIKSYEDKGLISQIKPQGERGQNRVIVFNPQLVWKGDLKLKNYFVRRILQNGYDWRK